MQTIKSICYICGSEEGFIASEDTVLLREARCKNCDAILRSSDLAEVMIQELLNEHIGLREAKTKLMEYKILNSCSSGHIHEALKDLPRYTCVEYYDEVPKGNCVNGILSDDFQALTFQDECFDIIISEDVLEHIQDTHKAFSEIERVLKNGGHHFFTIPFHENKKTLLRKEKATVYHGDPIRKEGALVITDWGNDIEEYVVNEKMGLKRYVMHRFHDKDEITDVDASYEQYISEEPLKYYKYNSVVFDSYKKGIRYTGERYVPGEVEGEINIEHTQRYLFAKQFAKDKIVLDAACGEGYGSSLIGEVAKQVCAIDIDGETIENAQKKYNHSNINFIESSIAEIPFNDNMFDTVISFETIEHVPEDVQKKFLEQVKRVIKDEGIFIISTPNKYIYTDKVKVNNPYHIKEFYREEFVGFLKNYFSVVKIYNQFFNVGYHINEEDSKYTDETSINNDDARYYIAVCSQKEINVNVDTKYTFYDNDAYFQMFTRSNVLDKELSKVNKEFIAYRDESGKFVKHLQEDIKILKQQIDTLNRNIDELREVVTHRDKDIEELKEVIDHRDKDIEGLKELIVHRDKDVCELKETVASKQNEVEVQRQQLIEQSTQIEVYQELKRHPIKYAIKSIRRR